ncbi:MAG: lysine-2,3-aminomutase-like protein [Micavibrio aeruginosavorus]|uniref:Lysine-2,3-aminomutase-like protein n=1 Tax=Micavibrio aeruginosavorus TaxID=349221 RepID=A0A2W5MYJ5_9BACT|nr:MAG: lysine-2,3-aminomutase-like protein [Micavibrio aeruginosavorus]
MQKPASKTEPDVLLTEQVRRTIRAPDDAVARQYLPDTRENIILPEEDSDPIGDDAHSPVKGLVHRYPDRVLFKVTDTCAVYCRFCFRKDMVGQGKGVLTPFEIGDAINYIRANPQIREVIFSGGDPLTLSNRRLENILDALNEINHLEIIRFHTRAPLVHPARIDDGLVALFQKQPKALYVVLHVNHPQEIDGTVQAVFRRLSLSGATLLSQSVLLKGINNDAAVLEQLFRTLLANRVKPYYLHHPDMATGTSHFRVTIKEGQDIMRTLRGRVTGLAYPTYVLDIPGGFGKIPLTPSYLESLENGTYNVTDVHGQTHAYPPKGVSRG